MEGLISVNGKITSPDHASISPMDRGFLFGDNVFEVMVAFGHQILDLDAHLNRLRESAALIRLDLPWSLEELKFEINTLVEQLGFAKSYIRVVVTRGTGLGLKPSPHSSPNRIIYGLTPNPEPSDIYQQGLALKLNTQGTRRGAQAKTGNYLTSIIALHDAKQEGYDDILGRNDAEEITEASTANVFFIGREGDLVEIATPPQSSGILLGITRNRLIGLLEDAKIPVTVRTIFSDELARFDEAFLTSTVRGLVPVRRIGKQTLHSTRPQAVFHHITRLYRAWVTSHLGYEVDWQTGLRRQD